ncbi:MAG: siaT 2 [Proteobacteria bacterium]|nr:siaT 2 [Pseudomonadota bacterium]
MNFLKHLDDWLANLCTFVIVIITVVAVFMRYILNDPLQWVEEVLIAIYIWAIMLGAASAMKHRGHVSIDALVMALPKRAQRYVQFFNDVVSIVVLSMFGWLGLQLAMAAQDKITPILGIKYIYVDFAVPIGAFWMVIYLLIHLVRDIRQASNEEN